MFNNVTSTVYNTQTYEDIYHGIIENRQHHILFFFVHFCCLSIPPCFLCGLTNSSKLSIDYLFCSIINKHVSRTMCMNVLLYIQHITLIINQSINVIIVTKLKIHCRRFLIISSVQYDPTAKIKNEKDLIKLSLCKAFNLCIHHNRTCRF